MLFFAALSATYAGISERAAKNAESYRCVRIRFPSEMALQSRTLGGPENPDCINADIRLAVRSVENPNPIRQAAAEIFTDSRNTLRGKISTPSSISKSEKFVKLAKLNASAFTNAPVFRLGNVYILIFDIPKNSRLKKGMNYVAFKYANGKLLWDISFKDPTILLLLDADYRDATNFELAKIAEEKDSNAAELLEDNLPMLTFKGIPLTNLNRDPEIDSNPTAKYYREIQKIFLALKLDEYSQKYTPASMKRFRAQFLTMGKDTQKSMLADYMKWEKNYLKFVDGGDLKILFFAREREGEKSHLGATFFEYSKGAPFIWGFESNRSAFDMFLSKYFLSGGDLKELMSEKFLMK